MTEGPPTPDWEAIARAAVQEWFVALWQFLRRRFLWTLALALLGYILWRSRAIVTTVIVSLTLASAVGALVGPLCRSRPLRVIRPHHLRRTVAAGLIFLTLALGLAGSFLLLLHPFQQEYRMLAQNWPAYQKQLLNSVEQARGFYGGLPEPLRAFLEKQQKGGGELPGAALIPSLLGTTVSWASHIIELILLPVLAFYFVVDGRALKKEFLRFVPRERLRPTLAVLAEGGSIMRDYLIAQFWLAFIAFVVVWIMLASFRMNYAVILALIAGVTRAVPVIGPLLGGIPVVTLAFVQSAQQGNHTLWVAVLVVFTLMHLVESKIIMPKFLGHRLHLHAVVIIVALLLGGEFFGLLGMFLAAPAVALARTLLLHVIVYPRQRRLPAPTQRREERAPRLERAIPGRARVSGSERPVRATSPPHDFADTPRKE